MRSRSNARRSAAGLALVPFVLAPWAVAAADGSPAPASPAASVAVDGGAGAPAPVVAQDDLDPALSDALAAALTTAFAETSAPGVIVGLVTPEGRWVAAIGSQELGADGTRGSTPMTPDLHLRIGDLTTTFTVTALLQAVDQGLVALDDQIGAFVLELPNKDATLAQLAGMRSGIADFTRQAAYLERYLDDPAATWLSRELIDTIRGTDPEFPAGDGPAWSDTNGVLLGSAIESAGGLAIQEAIGSGILSPLGLAQTSFPFETTVPEPAARGYTLLGQKAGSPAEATGWSPTASWAAGAMISTVDDLLAWGEALISGEGLLSPELQSTRMASLDEAPTDGGPAFGLGLTLTNGWAGAAGSVPGYSSVLRHHLAEDVTLVVLANSDIPSGACAADVATLPGASTDGPCEDPAAHVAAAVAEALGLPLDAG